MPDDRRALAARLCDEGRTLAEIGAEFGLTRERVRQILAGVPRRCSTCPNPIDSRRMVAACDACRSAAKPPPKPPGFPAENLEGRRFGSWSVARRLPNIGRHAAFECRCDCGRVKPVFSFHLQTAENPKCKSCAAKGRGDRRRNAGGGA